MKNKILNIKADYQNDVSNQIDLSKVKVKRVWTIYDEEIMWNNFKFNPITGKSVDRTDISTLHPVQHAGVFLEDRGHDWEIRNNKIDFFSRVVERYSEVSILIQYEEIQ